MKKNTKKLIAAVLMSMTIMSMVGCGNNTNNEPESEVQTETQTVLKEEIKVTITDDNGNKITLEGETKTDSNGNTVIEATDSAGNKVTLDADIKTDDKGNTVVENVTIKNPETTTIVTDNKETAAIAKPIEKVEVETETKVEVITKPVETQPVTTKPTTAPTEAPTTKPTEATTQSVTQPTTQAPTSHEHNYIATTSTVHHDAVTHTETVQNGTKTVVDKEAWDENTYNTTTYLECTVCNIVFTCNNFNEPEIMNYFQKIVDHYLGGKYDDTTRFITSEGYVTIPEYMGQEAVGVIDNKGLKFCFTDEYIDWYRHAKEGGYYIAESHGGAVEGARKKWMKMYVPGTYVLSSVHHDAVTHQEPNYETKTVVDKAAWDETVTTYKCSCGATK